LKEIADRLEKVDPSTAPGPDGFAKVFAFVPFNSRMINGDTATFVLKRFILSGQHWVRESTGKMMFKTITVCTADAPKVDGTLTGGPLVAF
jgi:hypothetical protein